MILSGCKANRGGCPLQYYLRAQTLHSKRQSETARSIRLSAVIIVWLLCVEGTREARVVLLLLFISPLLDKCVQRCEHLIEEMTGEVIFNDLYAL